MFARLTGLAAFTLAVSSALADPTCLTTEKRIAPGRDIPFSNYNCPHQIKSCAILCTGGEPSANTCVSDNNEGVDNPFKVTTYCFECVCADGSTPDLAKYYDTIPYAVCSLSQQNCQYTYNQRGQVAPDGACPTCGKLTPVKPTGSNTTSTPAPTTSSAAVTTSGGVEVVTSSAVASSTAVSTSTSAPETTSSTSSVVSSAQTKTVPLSTTMWASNTTSALTTHSPSSPSGSATTTAVTSVQFAGAASVEPAMAVFGMVLAAAFAL